MTGLRTIWGVSLERSFSNEFGKNYYEYLFTGNQRICARASCLSMTENNTLIPPKKGKFLADGLQQFYYD